MRTFKVYTEGLLDADIEDVSKDGLLMILNDIGFKKNQYSIKNNVLTVDGSIHTPIFKSRRAVDLISGLFDCAKGYTIKCKHFCVDLRKTDPDLHIENINLECDTFTVSGKLDPGVTGKLFLKNCNIHAEHFGVHSADLSNFENNIIHISKSAQLVLKDTDICQKINKGGLKILVQNGLDFKKRPGAKVIVWGPDYSIKWLEK